MTQLEYEWVGEDNDADIYWQDEYITTAENENPPAVSRNGTLPTNPDILGAVADWMATLDIPNDLGNADAIMILARLEAEQIEERDGQS